MQNWVKIGHVGVTWLTFGILGLPSYRGSERRYSGCRYSEVVGGNDGDFEFDQKITHPLLADSYRPIGLSRA